VPEGEHHDVGEGGGLDRDHLVPHAVVMPLVIGPLDLLRPRDLVHLVRGRARARAGVGARVEVRVRTRDLVHLDAAVDVVRRRHVQRRDEPEHAVTEPAGRQVVYRLEHELDAHHHRLRERAQLRQLGLEGARWAHPARELLLAPLQPRVLVDRVEQDRRAAQQPHGGRPG